MISVSGAFLEFPPNPRRIPPDGLCNAVFAISLLVQSLGEGTHPHSSAEAQQSAGGGKLRIRSHKLCLDQTIENPRHRVAGIQRRRSFIGTFLRCSLPGLSDSPSWLQSWNLIQTQHRPSLRLCRNSPWAFGHSSAQIDFETIRGSNMASLAPSLSVHAP